MHNNGTSFISLKSNLFRIIKKYFVYLPTRDNQMSFLTVFGLFSNKPRVWAIWHAMTNDSTRWVRSAFFFFCSQHPPQELYSWSCQRARIRRVRKCDCSSSWIWPEEVKLVRLMPAATISLLFISNLLDHPSIPACKKSLCQDEGGKAVFSFFFFCRSFLTCQLLWIYCY